MNTVDFKLNGNSFITKPNISIIESCKFTGTQIPRFCYHESLSISGNCRMCLVELETTDKLVLACLTNVESGFEIITNSLAVKKARENILESLLLNHPLDCPICDQGGECDLQDQTKIYGNFSNKMFSKRRGVEDKNFGSLIKTIMTRCIHCTRCVRYSTEILGIENLGTLNRGNLTEIGTYVSKYKESNISGNVIDLCPVGALTNRNNQFKTRPWELRSIETIDLTDSLGSSLFVNFKETEIVRILPKSNLVNGNIISNKARFSYDSLSNNRVYDFSRLCSQKWQNLLYHREEMNDSKKEILVVINEHLDLKTINKLKFLTYINQHIKLRSLSRFTEFDNFFFSLKSSLTIYDKEISKCSILLGSFLEIENEILNTKIRLKTLNQDYSVYDINRKYMSKNLNVFINLNLESAFRFLEGKYFNLSEYIIEKSPNFIIGESFKKRYLNTNYLNSYLNNLNNNISTVTVSSCCNSEANYFLGIKSVNTRDLIFSDFFVFIQLTESIILKKLISFIRGDVFWCNSFSHNTAKKKFLIPENLRHFEASGTFLNLEHKFQKTQRIFKSLSTLSGSETFINSFYEKFKYRFNYLDFINKLGSTTSNDSRIRSFSKSLSKSRKNKQMNFVSTYPVKMYFQDITKTDSFLSNSYTMSISSLNLRFNSF